MDRGFVLVAVVAVLSGACSSAANGGQRADAGAESGADAGDGACPSEPDAGYGPCEKGRVIIPKGGTYLTEDGCQACTCTSDGGVSCKDQPCGLDCSDYVFVYNEGLLNAQGCTTDSDCTGRRNFGLHCPCPVVVNEKYNSDAGPTLPPDYVKRDCDRCNAAFTCKACSPIVDAHCDQGFCQPVYGP